jgi:hypothetical protein
LRQIIAAVLAAAALACSTPAAQQNPLSGWKVRADGPETPNAGAAVHADARHDSLTLTTGPAAIYYKPDMKAEKDYTVSATFSQLTPTPQPQPYGLFIAGADLDKDTARYTAFLVRGDGRYQIAQWNHGTPKVIVDWSAAPQMRELKGVKTSNSLAIRALQGAVHFFIGEKEVHQMPRTDAGLDGTAGVRMGAGLNVQVDNLSVKKFP